MGCNEEMSLNDRILQYLESVGGFDTYDFAQKIKEDHVKIVGAVKSLLAYDELVTTENRSRTLWALTPEGNEFVNEGSKEMRVFKLVPSEGLPIAQVMTQGTKIGFNKAVANGWLRVEKGIVKPSNAPTEDTVQIHLDHIFKNCSEKVSQADKDVYKKRKLIEQVIVNSLYVDKGEKFTVELQKVENDLTAEMIATGAWKDLVFKPYNYNSMGTLPEGGHLHPLLKVRAQIRQIFLEMGFTEMPTNNYVESSFWNFDALFQPQQHPAREAHDTFFLSEPALSHQFPRDYLEQVKRVHSRGGFGSQGYGYEWQEEEAQKNLLRTHTTAVSARMLYKLAKEGFRPAKYFSIDRVFRNEELDATHLAEFQQVEGVIADHNLTLGNLIGVLSEFFKKMGMDQLRFKPAYNPYTEPSMEIFSYHNGLGKWIEVGNSGVFRPEMLLPMGLPEDVNVIAWGLSLERPTMIKYGIDNIRDLVGPRVDLQMVYDNPICRLDKEPTIEDKARSVEDTWQLLSFQVERMRNEIRRLHSLVNQSRHIICVDPSTPPYSLLVLLRLVKSFASKTVSVETNLHSALPLLSSYFNYYLSTDSRDTQHGKGSADFNFSFVWKQSGEVKLSFCSSQRDIVGEVNVCRYLARIAEENSSTLTLYERKGEVKSSQIDECVDIIHSLLTTSNREKQSDLLKRVDKLLVASPFITGSSVSVADICLWSAINQLSDIDIIPLNIRKFFVRCCNHPWFAPHLSLN